MYIGIFLYIPGLNLINQLLHCKIPLSYDNRKVCYTTTLFYILHCKRNKGVVSVRILSFNARMRTLSSEGIQISSSLLLQ